LVPSLLSLPPFLSFEIGIFTLWHCVLDIYNFLFLYFILQGLTAKSL
jgi:hypothetical protein